MSSILPPNFASKMPQVFPGSTNIQQVASGSLFTAGNASACALIGHFFFGANPAAGAFFGATAGLLGLGLAVNYALKDITEENKPYVFHSSKGKLSSDMIDRVAKAALAFFAGGGISYLVANAVGLTISFPVALVLLTGPLLMTAATTMAITMETTGVVVFK